jgi:hypothetical protein
MRSWRIGPASGTTRNDAGVLVIVGRGPVTIQTLAGLRDLIVDRHLGQRIGALLFCMRGAVLLLTAGELDDALRQLKPAAKIKTPVAWCVTPVLLPLLDAHADYAVTLGGLRAAFDDRDEALAWARREAAPRLVAFDLAQARAQSLR